MHEYFQIEIQTVVEITHVYMLVGNNIILQLMLIREYALFSNKQLN